MVANTLRPARSPARAWRGTAVALSAAGALVVTAALSPTAAGAVGRAPSFNALNGYLQSNLVSDQSGVAQMMDPSLVNPWGLSHGPTTPIWASDNGMDVSTIYLGGKDGGAVAAAPLVVKIPDGAPTGQQFNDTPWFRLSDGMPAFFIFASENGDVDAWNPSDATMAEHKAGTVNGVFKGIALQHNGSFPRLLVADFRHNKVRVLNRAFQPVSLGPSAFHDPSLPDGYAPFNIAVFGSRVFVSYAKQDAFRHDDVAGPGHGFIDVYGPNGGMLMRFASRGVLNSPWGMTLAPLRFGPFTHDLLVGNFGDGRIHAFNPWTGHLDGTLRDTTGAPIAIDGLWGLLAGNGTAADQDDLWFSAGPDHESHGLLGILRSARDEI